jgi:hypothetical protein
LHPFRAAAKVALVELALSDRSESNGRHLWPVEFSERD